MFRFKIEGGMPTFWRQPETARWEVRLLRNFHGGGFLVFAVLLIGLVLTTPAAEGESLWPTVLVVLVGFGILYKVTESWDRPHRDDVTKNGIAYAYVFDIAALELVERRANLTELLEDRTSLNDLQKVLLGYEQTGDSAPVDYAIILDYGPGHFWGTRKSREISMSREYPETAAKAFVSLREALAPALPHLSWKDVRNRKVRREHPLGEPTSTEQRTASSLGVLCRDPDWRRKPRQASSRTCPPSR